MTDRHFILEVIKSGDVNLKYVKTEHNPADLMTKSLHKVKHLKFTHALLGLHQRPRAREAKTNASKTKH